MNQLICKEWFECLSIQSELYMNLEKYKEMEELNDLLLNKMPWLSALNISKKVYHIIKYLYAIAIS